MIGFQNDESYYLKYLGLDDEFSSLSELGVISIAAASNGMVVSEIE